MHGRGRETKWVCAVASETKVQDVELKVQPCGGREREREKASQRSSYTPKTSFSGISTYILPRS